MWLAGVCNLNGSADGQSRERIERSWTVLIEVDSLDTSIRTICGDGRLDLLSCAAAYCMRGSVQLQNRKPRNQVVRHASVCARINEELFSELNLLTRCAFLPAA